MFLIDQNQRRIQDFFWVVTKNFQVGGILNAPKFKGGVF